MLKLSKRIFVFYGLLLLIYLIFNLALLPLILLMIIISMVIIIITVLGLFRDVINRKVRIKTLILLLLPLWSIYTIRSINLNREYFLRASREEVINGADITFYQDKSMEYCSLNLIGEQCYKGNYEFIDNVFIVNYTCGTPMLKSTRMLIIGSDLLFMDEPNNTEYKFDIEREYLK